MVYELSKGFYEKDEFFIIFMRKMKKFLFKIHKTVDNSQKFAKFCRGVAMQNFAVRSSVEKTPLKFSLISPPLL